MSWTDERVARLAKLWAEGLSASQIATDLGGVTRNAVIGKVHRLGLSGRTKPAAQSTSSTPRRKAAPRKAASPSPKPQASEKPSSTTTAKQDNAPTADVLEQVYVEPKVDQDLSAPKSKKLTLLQITDSTCRWPTGDPTMPGFSFCGHQTKDDKPYCGFHNKLAFHPPNDRRRRR